MHQIYQKWVDDSATNPFHTYGSVGNPIRVMEQEHEHAGESLRSLRELSINYRVPDDGCAS
jgi:regulator of cell morphogenesis and NO signaling